MPNTERLLAFLDGLGREYEVIIGSNGSTDSTTALGVDLSRRFPQVTFFHVPQRGVGLAFREFVQRARHPFLVSLDMDLSIDLDFVERALDAPGGPRDRRRARRSSGKQKRSFVRRFGSDTFLRMARLLLGIDYDDYSIAAKAYRVDTARRFIDRINEGSSYVIEMCFLTKRAGGRIVQIPVECEDWRKSKFNLLNEAVYKYSHLFGLWLKGRRMPRSGDATGSRGRFPTRTARRASRGMGVPPGNTESLNATAGVRLRDRDVQPVHTTDAPGPPRCQPVLHLFIGSCSHPPACAEAPGCQEARVFGRYLVDATPAPDVVARYRAPSPRCGPRLPAARRRAAGVRPAPSLERRAAGRRRRARRPAGSCGAACCWPAPSSKRRPPTPTTSCRARSRRPRCWDGSSASGISTALLAVAGLALVADRQAGRGDDRRHRRRLRTGRDQCRRPAGRGRLPRPHARLRQPRHALCAAGGRAAVPGAAPRRPAAAPLLSRRALRRRAAGRDPRRCAAHAAARLRPGRCGGTPAGRRRRASPPR